ncbi:MAG: helix-turn-helix transcriptional regulator, partial [Candidatus Bathyarchaeota archaeon]
MITNERQLKINKAQLREFKKHLEKIQKVRKDENLELLKLEEEAIQNQIKEFDIQINEYEKIWNSKTPIPKLLSINDIPKALIRARLSQGMSQKEFANKIGLKEQQIQRYEADEYESASLARIKEFADFFNIKLQDETDIPSSTITFQDFVKNMKKAGFDNDF